MVRHCYVHISVTIPQLLQLNVMPNFSWIASGHVCSFLIVKLLLIKGKETSKNMKCYNGKGDRLQMEVQ
jgi:hypothetical protein